MRKGGDTVGTCVIFCAGGFDAPVEPIRQEDWVLAADGGLAHLQKLGIGPDVILGDFDSLGYVPEGAEVHPVEKDDTDAMLALRRGLERGYRRFVIYGGMDGPRVDHTVANFQTLQYAADHGAFACLVGLEQNATVVKNGAIGFPETAAGTVSVFCMGAEARGVSIRGLKYSLEDGLLSPGFPLGVSNQFVGQKARIGVEQGSLLVIYDRANGLPETAL